jgi:hypothetical protein
MSATPQEVPGNWQDVALAFARQIGADPAPPMRRFIDHSENVP